MISVHVRLHGALRDKLPPEAKGRATLTLAEGATIAALFDQLSLRRSLEVALNGEIVDNQERPLQDGDRLEFFRAAAGGQRR